MAKNKGEIIKMILAPCEDEIDFLKEIYEVRPYVRVVTAEKIDIQQDLVRFFFCSPNFSVHMHRKV